MRIISFLDPLEIGKGAGALNLSLVSWGRSLLDTECHGSMLCSGLKMSDGFDYHMVWFTKAL